MSRNAPSSVFEQLVSASDEVFEEAASTTSRTHLQKTWRCLFQNRLLYHILLYFMVASVRLLPECYASLLPDGSTILYELALDTT
jgi:hypothetical protein